MVVNFYYAISKKDSNDVANNEDILFISRTKYVIKKLQGYSSTTFVSPTSLKLVNDPRKMFELCLSIKQSNPI